MSAEPTSSMKEDPSSVAEAPTKPEAIEFEPPLACVRRILKNSLPNVNVGKDASAAFSRASGIFIIYLTACANDFAREHKRQTITANDVLAAVKELDFDEFTPEMTSYLEAFRSAEKEKKDAKAKAKEGPKSEGAMDALSEAGMDEQQGEKRGSVDTEDEDEDEDEAPDDYPVKRLKLDQEGEEANTDDAVVAVVAEEETPLAEVLSEEKADS